MPVLPSLVHQLQHWADHRPDEPAIHGKLQGRWVHRTWLDYWRDVRSLGKAFIDLGHRPGECIAILADNRMEWVLTQFGANVVQGIPAPIYVTCTVEQTAYILGHAKARIAVCDSREQMEKLLAAADHDETALEHIIVMDEVESDDPRVHAFDKVLRHGSTFNDVEVDARFANITEYDVALLIYTSGTTGVPKAVQLDGGAMVAAAQGALMAFPVIEDVGLRIVSYLPLSHVAEQMFTNMNQLAIGGQVFFCPELSAVKDYLVEVRPTAFVGVPRVWEKFQAALEARMAEASPVKRRLADWAMKTELEAFRHQMRTGQPRAGIQEKLARKLVIDPIKERLGLDRLALAASGAAPISVNTLEFFASLGIVIHEAFGMSETSGAVVANPYLRPKFGTVGRPFANYEVQIADDGEIVMKGRANTVGYMGMPEKTAELIDGDGWLHTGDLGEIDDEGYLKITGRKKDIIITAGGKNVAPSRIEGLLKAIPGVSQAVVVGDQRPYLIALLVLDPEAVPELRSRLELPESVDGQALADHEKLRTFFEAQIRDTVNPELARYETIKRIHVIGQEFTVEGGELTPSMKVKRNVVQDKFADVIHGVYARPR